MGNITKKFNSYLPFFDHNDIVYKSVFCDKDGIPNNTIKKPIDLNLGAIASLLEYNRLLTIQLIDQVYLNKAKEKYLDKFGLFFDIKRIKNESDNEYYLRIKNYIFSHKVSPASIIDAVKQYSSRLPKIIEERLDSAFSDLSFSDYYTFNTRIGDPNSIYYQWYIAPAIASNSGDDSTAFYFILQMYNLQNQDIIKVIEIVNEWKASGVEYHIEIIYE